ncbi:MAG TPA: excinuclease ABC subunit UvrA [Phycisphaerales bacterium]|nr:excinuclease ABC subunit UvrA [Phycisphaerales bacterium]
MAEQHVIKVRGAREHNLKGLNVDIPRDQLVVITGVSGSGKSSLAFDTIFAEGQRKYMESLSAYARQFLDQLQKPNIESIEGLPPTIAIQQRTGGHNPRSTVATTTEIYDYLRLLFARCGTPTCWHGAELLHETEDSTEKTNRAKSIGKKRAATTCGKPITATSPTQIVDTLMAFPAGTRMMICSPVVRGKKGHHRDVIEALQKQGFVRARVNGAIIDIRDALKEGGENPLNLGRYEMHTIEAVVDRIAVSEDARQRIADSVEVALKLSEGLLVVLTEDASGNWHEHRFSEKFACPDHPECSLDELEPRLFSFNSPFGACPKCDGLGIVQEFEEAMVIEDPSLSIADGAVSAFARIGHVYRSWFSSVLKKVCKKHGIDRNKPFDQLPREHRRLLLYGAGGSGKTSRDFAGVIPILKERFENTDNERIKERLSTLLSQTPCPACTGKRLRTESLFVMLSAGSAGRYNIADITGFTIDQAIGFFDSLDLSQEKREIAAPILREINARLGFLASVGLNYLTLDRTASTLSGGEAQRIRLATQVGSGLVGVCYVLDEPTIGLHQRDNDRLIGTLRSLADIGNTVLVVEHDEDMIRSADHILDIGPEPGRRGGRVVAQGTLLDIMNHESSLTGAYLSGRRAIPSPSRNDRRAVSESNAIVVKGASANNLKGIDVAFPLGGMVCVTGVSGSGKSTLVNEVLLKAAKKAIYGSRLLPGGHKRINGLTKLDRVIEVDQSPIGRTPRSNPATYTGIFDDIRKLFTQTRESKIRGYQPGRFSFNVKGGRCEACQGQGLKKIEMHFLPDVFVTCEVCRGARYNRETLEIRYRDRNIADVLSMTVEDAVSFFDAHPRILRMVKCLHDVGLDYIELGQPSTTLSGGEAQRIKLASELGGSSSGHTLYVLDEPTTGLHFADVEKLLSVMNRLADQGNTLIVIEHNLDVIKCADWIIDLGPEGGDRGGTVVATGTPEAVAASKNSHTGRYLKPLLRTTAPSKERAAPARAAT